MIFKICCTRIGKRSLQKLEMDLYTLPLCGRNENFVNFQEPYYEPTGGMVRFTFKALMEKRCVRESVFESPLGAFEYIDQR